MTAAVLADLLERSNERDTSARRMLDAEKRGFALGVASRAGEFERGFAGGIEAYKAAQHDLHRDLQLELIRWDGLREHFGDPRPGDYSGGSLPLEMPGMVWLGGPAVHRHECASACYAYRHGWYDQADAADILEQLPGGYAAEVARLRGGDAG